MSERLSLWDLYQRTQNLSNQMATHGHPASKISGLHSCATSGNAATVNNHYVYKDVPSDAKFTDTVYTHPSTHPASMITGLHACATNGRADFATTTQFVSNNLYSTGITSGNQKMIGGYITDITVGNMKTNLGLESYGEIYCKTATSPNVSYLAHQGNITKLIKDKCGIGLGIDGGYVKLSATSGALSCSGTFSATKVYNAVWNDYAEWFERKDINEKLEPGDILSWNGNGVTKADKNNQNVIGVFSDTYGHIVGGEQLENMEDNIKKFVPVGLAGRVQVKVKGKVNPGDFIIASDIPGIGIAGSFTPGKTVGKALDKKDSENIERIKTLIITI